MKPLNTMRLSALTLAALLPFAVAAQSQPAPAPNAKIAVPKPHPLLAQSFNPQVGPKLLATVDQMTATLAAVTAPVQATAALAKILQIWPTYLQLDKDFTTQLEQIAAHHYIGKKTSDMASVETAMTNSLAVKGPALDAELLRLSKLPLAAADMAALQNLRKALAE